MRAADGGGRLGRSRVDRRGSALRKLQVLAVFGLAVLAFALVCAAADAETVVVGSPLLGEFPNSLTVSGLLSSTANTALGGVGAHVASPVSGTIVRWRTKGTFSGGGFRIRVLRPVGANYIGAGGGSFATPVGSSLQVFPTNVPIQAGDLIGLDAEGLNATYSVGNVVGSNYRAFSPTFPEGGSASPIYSNSGELGFDAEVVRTPTVIQTGPPSGALSGGTTVTIAGRDLEGATAVKFGASAAAANFTVVSDNEITAVAPPGAQPGAVDITVTTVGGTSTAVSGDKFTYLAPPVSPNPAPAVPSTSPPVLPKSPRTCTVPDVIGKHLPRAEKALVAAGCRRGTVTKAKGATRMAGLVTKEAPKPGTKVAAGTKVNVRLGAGHH
ncbi:MAG: IPT/TIG domain-containing protein [Actinobacteria bacterium]|nr:IPT/TIG domain-containing protein [Actinomycetota bacterium]